MSDNLIDDYFARGLFPMLNGLPFDDTEIVCFFFSVSVFLTIFMVGTFRAL